MRLLDQTQEIIQSLPPQISISTNIAAAGVATTSWMGYLPAIASIVSILWIGLQAFFLIREKLQQRKKDKQ